MLSSRVSACAAPSSLLPIENSRQVQPHPTPLFPFSHAIPNTHTSPYVRTLTHAPLFPLSSSPLTPPVLDLAKVVDVLVLAVHCEADWESSMFDEDADMLVSSLKAVGMPEVVCALQGMEALPPKKYTDIKRDGGRNIEDTLVPEIKSFEISVVQDPARSTAAAMDVASLDFSKRIPSIGRDGTAQMIRCLSGMTARNMQWRSIRSYLLSEGSEAVAAPEGYSEGAQAIKLKGFLRGRPMCVNHLMHVLGGGTARVVSITTTPSPFDHSHRPGGGGNVA